MDNTEILKAEALRAEALKKITAYVGFALKAGGVRFGFESVKSGGKKNYAVLADGTLSDKSKKEIAFWSKKNKVGLMFFDRLDEITRKTGVKVMSVTNKELAEQILRNARSPSADKPSYN
ncbi:MAG: hypothetical protein LBP79_02455 [Clostridiales bacterium]|jgi:hypothetical protein|nr:hypothetical protein [Clostridiales bacterium]